MKKISTITIALTLVGLIFLLRLGPGIAHGLEEAPFMNPVVSSSSEGIKALSARLFTEVKKDADEKLWSPAMNSVEWLVENFLGESAEMVRSGLETYVLSEEALDSFTAVAALKIDQAVTKYLTDTNRRPELSGSGAEQYASELRRAVDVDSTIKNIYSGLIANSKDRTLLEQRYWRFRRQNPGLDAPMELFVLVGGIADGLLKAEGKEIDAILNNLLLIENDYQSAKINFQQTLKAGLIAARTQFNSRLQALLERISEKIKLY